MLEVAAARVVAVFTQEWLLWAYLLLLATGRALDSNQPAGARRSESETPLSERSDGRVVFSQDPSEAALNCTLASIPQKLQHRADGKTSSEPPAAQGFSLLHRPYLPVHCLLVVTHLSKMSTESGSPLQMTARRQTGRQHWDPDCLALTTAWQSAREKSPRKSRSWQTKS